MIKYFKEADIKFINFMVDCIDIECPIKRRPKYNTFYYISNIYYVLKTGISWNALLAESHYTAIYKKFIYWNTNKVFDNIYNNLVENYIQDNIIKNA